MDWKINVKQNQAEQEGASDYIFLTKIKRLEGESKWQDVIFDYLKQNKSRYSDFVRSVLDTAERRRELYNVFLTEKQLKALYSYFADHRNAELLSDLYRHCNERLKSIELTYNRDDVSFLAEHKSAIELASMYIDAAAELKKLKAEHAQLVKDFIRLNEKGQTKQFNQKFFNT